MDLIENLEGEEWRDVARYEGLYNVSNLGRMKSIAHITSGKGGHRLTKGIILKTPLNGDGYPIVNLCKGGHKKSVKVHSLVAIAFLDHQPDAHKLVVDHINGVKNKNSVDNLRIVTSRFNSSFGEVSDKHTWSSQYVGVHMDKITGRWVSTIWMDGRSKFLGLFVNEIDAASAYQNELEKYLLLNNQQSIIHRAPLITIAS